MYLPTTSLCICLYLSTLENYSERNSIAIQAAVPINRDTTSVWKCRFVGNWFPFFLDGFACLQYSYTESTSAKIPTPKERYNIGCVMRIDRVWNFQKFWRGNTSQNMHFQTGRDRIKLRSLWFSNQLIVQLAHKWRSGYAIRKTHDATQWPNARFRCVVYCIPCGRRYLATILKGFYGL